MDKQFARILMLSVLLPAGAALAEAIQHENISFAAMDQSVMSKLTGALPVDIGRKAVSEDKHSMETALNEYDNHALDEAHGGVNGSGNTSKATSF